MKFKWILLSNVLVVLITLVIKTTPASAEIEPIFPNENTVFGMNYILDVGIFKPYLGVASDFDNNTIYDHIGSKLMFTSITLDLNYGYWYNTKLAGYSDQKGIEISLYFNGEPDHSYQISLFDGVAGHSLQEQSVATDQIYFAGNKQLLFDGNNEIKLYFDLTDGMVKQDNKSYFTTNLRLSCRIKNLRILPRFGYASFDGLVDPYFDLRDSVRGYDLKQIRGNRLAAITFDQQIPLFPYSDVPFLGLLNWSLFADAGDVLTVNESIKDFKLRGDIGTGLAMMIGTEEFRLDLVESDQGAFKVLFYVKMVY